MYRRGKKSLVRDFFGAKSRCERFGKLHQTGRIRSLQAKCPVHSSEQKIIQNPSKIRVNSRKYSKIAYDFRRCFWYIFPVLVVNNSKRFHSLNHRSPGRNAGIGGCFWFGQSTLTVTISKFPNKYRKEPSTSGISFT